MGAALFSYNLLSNPFAPFLCVSGGVRWLAVPEIVDCLPDGDYAIEPAWPRADLDTATYEFLIGLLSVAMRPRSLREWHGRYRHPPSCDELQKSLESLLPAFNVIGDGPLFMQETGIEGDATPIEALFIDTPGESAHRKNSDLLTHRNRYRGLGLAASAMALYAMQAFAPAGGAGIRTSMRGGGPLTALVIPEGDDRPLPLWQRLWANVIPSEGARPLLDEVFPWMKPQLPVGKEAGGREIHQGASGFDERLHPFFGMPRRIRLIVAGEGRCDLTGRDGPLITGLVQRPYGLNYGAWRHPLTPYRRQKAADTPYSAKPKSGRFGYRDWVAVTIGDGRNDEQSLSLAAENVAAARHQFADELSDKDAKPRARVRVAGWAMNNMEAISYLTAEEPLPLAERSLITFMDELGRRMAEGGESACSLLRSAVKSALALKDDKGVVEQARTAFYADTDGAFHDLLSEAVVDESTGDLQKTAIRWLAHVRRSALSIFDTICPVPLADTQTAQRIVSARSFLVNAFAGRGKAGNGLYDRLGLRHPQKEKKEEAA